MYQHELRQQKLQSKIKIFKNTVGKAPNFVHMTYFAVGGKIKTTKILHFGCFKKKDKNFQKKKKREQQQEIASCPTAPT